MNILNLPNLLTSLRLLLIPFILFFLFSAEDKGLLFVFIGFFIYLVAIITDYLDGLIARKQNLTSKFGAFFDSLVDKIIVLSLFFSFLSFSFWHINIIFIIIILVREVLLTIMRIWAIVVHYSLKTEYHGKIKTVLQMTTQIILWILLIIYYALLHQETVIANFWLIVFQYLPNSLLLITMSFSVYSGVTYLLQNKSLFIKKK